MIIITDLQAYAQRNIQVCIHTDLGNILEEHLHRFALKEACSVRVQCVEQFGTERATEIEEAFDSEGGLLNMHHLCTCRNVNVTAHIRQ